MRKHSTSSMTAQGGGKRRGRSSGASIRCPASQSREVGMDEHTRQSDAEWDIRAFAVGVAPKGDEYAISITTEEFNDIFRLRPEQASIMAGMLLAAMAKHGREP